MKIKLILAVLIVVAILAGCESATNIAVTNTAIPSQTPTLVLPTSSPSPTIWWTMATPLGLSYGSSEEITSIINKLHPYKCIRENLLTVNPTPIEPAMQVSWLTFTKIAILPEPKPDYINEQADNIDKSLTVFAMPSPGAVGNLYVRDNKTGVVYQVDFGATTDRPFDWLQWINKDTFIVAQQGHLWTLFVAVNVEKQEFEYYGMTPGCPMATPTP